MSIYHSEKRSCSRCDYYPSCNGCLHYKPAYTEYTDEEQQIINEDNYLLFMTAIAIIVLFIILVFPAVGIHFSYIILQKDNLIFKDIFCQNPLQECSQNTGTSMYSLCRTRPF